MRYIALPSSTVYQIVAKAFSLIVSMPILLYVLFEDSADPSPAFRLEPRTKGCATHDCTSSAIAVSLPGCLAVRANPVC
jgi:hypothetical protein